MKTIEISYNNKKIYDICLDQSYKHFADKLKEIGFSGRKICIVTDSNVAPLYLHEIQQLCLKTASKVVSVIFDAGEEHKNLDTIEMIYEKLIVERFDRKDCLIALGGGVTGDMTGYAAATYLRGISFIQLPTTLLAQVDSSIGGKTGVDFRNYKNMIGAFHQPSLVYMNLNTLNTLDQRQLSAGMAEVIKHGLIRDSQYYVWLKNHTEHILNKDYPTLEHMIYESCRIKADIVQRDPTEKGERALLNYGHTIGHAIEKLKNFKMLHGECIAVGSIAAAYISMRKGLLSKEEYADIIDVFESFALPAKINFLDPEDILVTTKSDKKMDGGKVKFILLESIGNAVIDSDLTDFDILDGVGACI